MNLDSNGNDSIHSTRMIAFQEVSDTSVLTDVVQTIIFRFINLNDQCIPDYSPYETKLRNPHTSKSIKNICHQ